MFLADDLPGRPRGTRRGAARRDGLAGPAADRRHGRRPSADVEGRRGRVVVRATTPTSTTCSCRSGRIGPRSPTTRTVATCSPAVGPFAIEQGLVAADERGDARPHLDAQHPDPRRRRWSRRRVDASATTAPRASTACPAPTRRSRSSSSTSPAPRAARCCRPGNVDDVVEGSRVTCIDNGMPVVCIAASDVGLSGQEAPAELEADAGLTPSGSRRSGSPPGR